MESILRCLHPPSMSAKSVFQMPNVYSRNRILQLPPVDKNWILWLFVNLDLEFLIEQFISPFVKNWILWLFWPCPMVVTISDFYCSMLRKAEREELKEEEDGLRVSFKRQLTIGGHCWILINSAKYRLTLLDLPWNCYKLVHTFRHCWTTLDIVGHWGECHLVQFMSIPAPNPLRRNNNCLPTREWKVDNIGQQNLLKRLQMVQLECPRHPIRSGWRVPARKSAPWRPEWEKCLNFVVFGPIWLKFDVHGYFYIFWPLLAFSAWSI